MGCLVPGHLGVLPHGVRDLDQDDAEALGERHGAQSLQALVSSASVNASKTLFAPGMCTVLASKRTTLLYHVNWPHLEKPRGSIFRGTAKQTCTLPFRSCCFEDGRPYHKCVPGGGSGTLSGSHAKDGAIIHMALQQRQGWEHFLQLGIWIPVSARRDLAEEKINLE